MNRLVMTLGAVSLAAIGLAAADSTTDVRARPVGPGILQVATCAQHFTRQGNPALSYHYCHFHFALACGPGRVPNKLYAGGKVVDVHPMGAGKYRVTYVCTNSGR